jgi:hypothetical protein
LIRNIEDFKKILSKDEFNQLRSFPGLETDEAIAEWHKFCRDLSEEHPTIKSKLFATLG